jgi:trans-aconitate methyltransferase
MADGSPPPGDPDPVGPAPAVRPFLVTAGRVAPTASVRPVPVETQVVATADGLAVLEDLTFEQHDIVAACRQPQSVAELAARLRLHLNVVRVLAEDLRAAGYLVVHVPDSGVTHDASVLRRVIEALRAIPDSRGVLRDTD